MAVSASRLFLSVFRFVLRAMKSIIAELPELLLRSQLLVVCVKTLLREDLLVEITVAFPDKSVKPLGVSERKLYGKASI